MSNFNYQKAYCTIALPAFNNLSETAKIAHSDLIPLVADLQQDRALNIPMTPDIRGILQPLTTLEIAKMSQSSYFVGHWKPSFLDSSFSNTRGESWKIANCCDQILRERLAPLPHNIQIHEGKLRVTFSNKDCWLWEEFALATEENLQTFKACGLPFGETALKKSAKKLISLIGDLWPDVDSVPDNDLYREYLGKVKDAQKAKIQQVFTDRIARLKQKMLDAQKEVDFLTLCNDNDIPIDNVIYYSHKNEFCFGWKNALFEAEKKTLRAAFSKLQHNYTITYK